MFFLGEKSQKKAIYLVVNKPTNFKDQEENGEGEMEKENEDQEEKGEKRSLFSRDF